MTYRIRRNWPMAYLLVLTLVWVISATVYHQQVGIIAASFPRSFQYIWYGGLFVGASIALIGVVLSTITGMMVERAALFIVSGLCLFFGILFVAVAMRDGVSVLNAIYAGPLVFFYGVVCAARVQQITDWINEYRKGLREIGDTLSRLPRPPREAS